MNATRPIVDESALLERVRSGDTRAFEELYRAHVGRIYAVCLRMTGNATEAEDLAQDAFVRAWQKIDSFRGESSFSTWVHRLTVNLVLSDRRSRKRRIEHETSTDDLTRYETKDTGRSPQHAVDLERAIAALPKGARNVFILHDIEGYRHKEIASLTGLATGTSKAQLHRARKLLREALA